MVSPFNPVIVLCRLSDGGAFGGGLFELYYGDSEQVRAKIVTGGVDVELWLDEAMTSVVVTPPAVGVCDVAEMYRR
ncbi:hypothetical protein F0562_033465 [Nyssa sinensis]|uniref:Uncharacterized protein n=1 Tax=Nyssa sinensis TaxID=561372 RepID=A0A5J5AHX6_9ASTE|nr:hypothetical protein F0562_033465 [Nyssa sinensis]